MTVIRISLEQERALKLLASSHHGLNEERACLAEPRSRINIYIQEHRRCDRRWLVAWGRSRLTGPFQHHHAKGRGSSVILVPPIAKQQQPNGTPGKKPPSQHKNRYAPFIGV
jgi:hypothetical protein